MAIFTPTGYCLKYNLTHPHKVIMHHIRDIHCAWQRATKGYCYRDLWDIDYWFLKTFPNMLDEFIEHNTGYPDGMTEDEWISTIKNMAKSFRNADDEQTEFINPYEEEYLQTLELDIENHTLKHTASEELENKYREAEKEKDEFMSNSLSEGMKLFHKYLRNLWD